MASSAQWVAGKRSPIAVIRAPRNVNAPPRRRTLIVRAVSMLALAATPRLTRSQEVARGAPSPNRIWLEAAVRMQRLAESWGDQPYGAVLVLNDQLIGEGPSRVVQRGDSTAHAEREAIHDAQRRLKLAHLPGSILYSTSRPCRACEAAAAAAGVSRMYFGDDLRDAGIPRQ